MTEFDIAKQCGVSITQLQYTPFYRQQEALVIIRARHEARMALAKQHKCSLQDIRFFGE